MNKHVTPYVRLQAEGGFSMIEVLVTLLVISLALLGTAGLQAYSMRLNQGGQYRSLAVFLAADLAERMEANKLGATAGSYALAETTAAAFLAGGGVTSTACTTDACNPTALANFDLLQWQGAVAASLPQSSWSVTQAVTGAQSSYTITIAWIDRRSNTSSATQRTTGGTSTTSGERFSYTANRTIYN